MARNCAARLRRFSMASRSERAQPLCECGQLSCCRSDRALRRLKLFQIVRRRQSGVATEQRGIGIQTRVAAARAEARIQATPREDSSLSSARIASMRRSVSASHQPLRCCADGEALAVASAAFAPRSQAIHSPVPASGSGNGNRESPGGRDCSFRNRRMYACIAENSSAPSKGCLAKRAHPGMKRIEAMRQSCRYRPRRQMDRRPGGAASRCRTSCRGGREIFPDARRWQACAGSSRRTREWLKSQARTRPGGHSAATRCWWARRARLRAGPRPSHCRE